MNKEILLSIAFLILLAYLVNPLELLWMPNMMEAFLVLVLVVLFALYSIYIWREKSADERDDLHRLFAGRFAFLSGAGILVVGIFYQGISHAIDPWLPLSLGVMVFSKILARLWKEKRN